MRVLSIDTQRTTQPNNLIYAQSIAGDTGCFSRMDFIRFRASLHCRLASSSARGETTIGTTPCTVVLIDSAYCVEILCSSTVG